MTLLYDRACAAYRALCELEDELDAAAVEGRATNELVRNELRCLRTRWLNDTARKVERALGAGQKPVNEGALIVDSLPDLRERIEARLTEYARERDWQKLREWEMANIAAEEAAVTMTQLVIDLRRSGCLT